MITQHILTTEELNDLRAKARTPEVVEEEQRNLANAALDLISECNRAIRPMLNMQGVVPSTVDRLNKAAENFCSKTGIRWSMFEQLSRERYQKEVRDAAR